MCVLVALRSLPGVLCLAANRDERTNRPWQPPQLLLEDPPVFGGRDLVAGGSWLAVNLTARLVVGVSNARLRAPAGERSRGELVVTLAREAGLADAAALLGELDLARYGPFNLLLADPRELWTATNAPLPLLRREEERAIAIGNDLLTTPSRRLTEVRMAAGALAGQGYGEVLDAFAGLLADHRGLDPLCRHGHGYGTVCSTLVALSSAGVLEYRFASGPPCTTAFVELALPPSPPPRH